MRTLGSWHKMLGNFNHDSSLNNSSIKRERACFCTPFNYLSISAFEMYFEGMAFQTIYMPQNWPNTETILENASRQCFKNTCCLLAIMNLVCRQIEVNCGITLILMFSFVSVYKFSRLCEWISGIFLHV